VTAYTSEVGQTDGSPCVAASGMNICNHYAAGELLCASNAYPFGTKLLIDEYGTCTVVDRMSRRYEDRVDLYFGFDTGAAREWGVQLVTIKPL
jgi:3D (Asp-Asp-Asp) domain-containing protein